MLHCRRVTNWKELALTTALRVRKRTRGLRERGQSGCVLQRDERAIKAERQKAKARKEQGRKKKAGPFDAQGKLKPGLYRGKMSSVLGDG